VAKVAPKLKKFFTRAEVAQMFEVVPNTVSRWARDAKLPCVLTPGGRRRYPVEAIQRTLGELQQDGPVAPAPVRKR
jgi:predicted site-specific integrase-resolvase